MNFQEIVDLCNFLPNQNEKLDLILDFSNNLVKIPSSLKSFEIKGCVSLVKMAVKKQGNKFYFYANSDSKMVGGIIFVILTLVNGKTKQEILDLNISEKLNLLNLSLTAQRQIGIQSVINSIKSILDN